MEPKHECRTFENTDMIQSEAPYKRVISCIECGKKVLECE